MNVTLVKADTRGQDLSQPQGKPVCPRELVPPKRAGVSQAAPRKAGLGRSLGRWAVIVPGYAQPRKDTDDWQRTEVPAAGMLLPL